MTDTPEGPDPGHGGAVFLGWLKKRSGIRKVSHCESKCKENGFTAKEFIQSVGEDHVLLARTSGGEKVIKLQENKRVWADQWMAHYGIEVPHHRHWVSWK